MYALAGRAREGFSYKDQHAKRIGRGYDAFVVTVECRTYWGSYSEAARGLGRIEIGTGGCGNFESECACSMVRPGGESMTRV